MIAYLLGDGTFAAGQVVTMLVRAEVDRRTVRRLLAGPCQLCGAPATYVLSNTRRPGSRVALCSGHDQADVATAVGVIQ